MDVSALPFFFFFVLVVAFSLNDDVLTYIKFDQGSASFPVTLVAGEFEGSLERCGNSERRALLRSVDVVGQCEDEVLCVVDQRGRQLRAFEKGKHQNNFCCSLKRVGNMK